MGIFDALTTAVSGLSAQSYALQNISGNIANSQTTAYKRINTSFTDLVADNIPSKQIAGGVLASSVATNNIQGDIQNAATSTNMAVNGNGYFIVEKPSSFTDNQPVFGGVNLYTRRGDFQLDKNGFLVNGAGYYLMGIPVDATTGNPLGSIPQTLQFSNNLIPAQVTSQIAYNANLPSQPKTPKTQAGVPGSELLKPAGLCGEPGRRRAAAGENRRHRRDAAGRCAGDRTGPPAVSPAATFSPPSASASATRSRSATEPTPRPSRSASARPSAI